VAGRRLLITGVASTLGTRLVEAHSIPATSSPLRRPDRALRSGRRGPGAVEAGAGAGRTRARPPAPVLRAPARTSPTTRAPDDRALVLEPVDAVRARLREKVYDSLVNRKGAM